MKKIRFEREYNTIQKFKEKYHLTEDDFSIDEEGHVSTINLSKREIKAIPFAVKNFPNLQILDLNDNQIKIIEGLDQLTNLNTLYLGRNEIAKIERLEKLKTLNTLILSRNEIKKIEGLDQLENLNTLFLDKNQISKIEGLDNLKDLEMLFLTWNKIEKIEGLEKLTKLNTLYLTRNQITELEGLGTLINLQSFRINENPLNARDKKIAELGIKTILKKCQFPEAPIDLKIISPIYSEAKTKNSEDYFLIFYDNF